MKGSIGRLIQGIVAAGAIVLSAHTAAAGPITFDFTGSQGGATGEGSMGNTRTFTSGGVTLWVTAWGYTYGSQNNAMEKAAVGRWNTGLGVCNVTETPCSSPNHQLDNVGSDDWMLFVFSTPVDITSVRIDPYGNYDRDVSYYVGNVSSIPLNLTGKNYNQLASLGFGSVQNDSSTASDNYRDVSIGGGYVNALLLGGYLGGSDQDDYFKVRSLSAATPPPPPPPPPSPPPPPVHQVPEPGSFLTLLMGSGAFGLMRLRKRKDSEEG